MTPRKIISVSLLALCLLFIPAKGAAQGYYQMTIPDSSSWTVEQAVSMIQSTDSSFRMAGLNRLSREPGPYVQQWIAKLAQNDSEARIRYTAVVALAKRKEQASLPLLRYLAINDPDSQVRALANQVLAEAASRPQALPPFQYSPTPPPPGQYGQPMYQPQYPPAYGAPPPKPVEVIRHKPVTQQLKMVPIPIYAEINPQVETGSVLLFYRTLGEKVFQQVEMSPHSKGRAATIDCKILQTFDPTGLEYYIMVLDSSKKKVLGNSGSETSPHRITIVKTLTVDEPALPDTAPPSACKTAEQGGELPPGLMEARLQERESKSDVLSDGGKPGTIDEELITDKKAKAPQHRGFLPPVGMDGAFGTPRDTLVRTWAGVTIGFERGSFSRAFNSSSKFDEGREDTSDDMAPVKAQSDNAFTFSDFSFLLSGRYSPIDFLEFGLDLEVLTYEKFTHDQLWYEEGDKEGNFDSLLNKKSDLYWSLNYGGVALGLTSASAKAIFIRTDPVRAGIAVRGTFPTHTGRRFNEGIGAANLFPEEKENFHITEPRTDKGLFWGVEPGIVASVVPSKSLPLTIYADISFDLMILTYNKLQARYEVDTQSVVEESDKLSSTNMLLIPNLGAQYRILNDMLGFQVALQPAFYLGTAQSPGLASFGLVPGVIYRFYDMIDVALTANIDLGTNAPYPLECTDLSTNNETAPTPCGVGRRWGFALSAGYDLGYLFED